MPESGVPTTLSTPISELSRLTTDLVALLDGQRREIDLSRGDSRIRRTIEWLMETQNQDGSWGPGGVAATAMTVIALDRVTRTVGDINVDTRPKIALAYAYLVESYHSGRFNNAMWDTAVIGRALLSNLNETTQPVVDSIRSHMISTIGVQQNAGPHHLAQRTLFLCESAAIRDIIIRSVQDLYSATVSHDGTFSPYTKAQVLAALGEVYPTIPDEYSEFASRIIDDLKRYLSTASLDSANFINICSSIEALSKYVDFSHRETLKTSAASLFGETCFRENGTWYYDHLSTAWALLALTSYSIEVVIVAPYAELRSRTAALARRAATDTFKEQRATVLKAVLAALAIGLAGVIITVYILWSTLASINWQWAQWALPTAAGAFFALGFARLGLLGRRFDVKGHLETPRDIDR
jgi:hypothetical protein